MPYLLSNLPTIITKQIQYMGLIKNNFPINWFDGLVGYGICLTRRTSPVRSWVESNVFFYFIVEISAASFFFAEYSIHVRSDEDCGKCWE